MSKVMLHMQDVTALRDKKRVLDIAELQVGRGELLSVLGANGSGKSTLLQVLNGLLPFSQGTIQLLGGKLQETDQVALRRRSALVFQDPLFVHDTVYANVALPLRFRRIPEKSIGAKVESVLAAFRCTHLANRSAHRLSGGETQRVCLARAFITEPELLLLDEPFSALDPATRNELLGELRTVALQRQVTVLLVTHNWEEALRFAGRAVVMEQGRIVQDCRPETIMRCPASLSVARLVVMDNVWPCHIELSEVHGFMVQVGAKIAFPVATVDKEGQGWCCLPGDSFRIIGESEASLSGVSVVVEVLQVIPGIGIWQVAGRAGDVPITLRLTVEQAATLKAGQMIQVAFQPAAAHILMA